MKQDTQKSKILLIVRWILAIIGFVVVTLSGKLINLKFYTDNDIMYYLNPLIIGILLMIPLFIYILKERRKL